MRVSEIAKELDLDSRTVLRLLQLWGHYVHSASSTLEDQVAEEVRSYFRAGSPRGSRVPRPIQLDDDEVDPQELAIRRIFGADRPGITPIRSQRPASSSLVRDSRGTPRRPRGPAKPLPDAWAMHWFDPDERDAWLRSGVDEPRDAQDLIDVGITPETRLKWGAWSTRAITRAREFGLEPEDMDKTLGNTPSIGLMLETGTTKSELQGLYVRSKATG